MNGTTSLGVTSFGWEATLVLLGVVFVAVVALWFWWSRPNRGRGRRRAIGFSEVDVEDSRERLDLLRAERRWGDISTIDSAYLRRRQGSSVPGAQRRVDDDD